MTSIEQVANDMAKKITQDIQSNLLGSVSSTLSKFIGPDNHTEYNQGVIDCVEIINDAIAKLNEDN